MIHTLVQYVDSNTFGGCEQVVLTLLDGLDRKRWQPMLFHHEESGIMRLLDEVSRRGIPCRPVPRVNGWNRLATLRQFVRELHAARPSIFHAHLGFPLGCRYGLMAAKLSRIPAIIATSHLYCPILGVRFRWLKQRVQAAMIDRYFAVSNEVKERLCEHLWVREGKIQVLHAGIQLAPFERPADPVIRSMLTGGSERPVIFTSARLHSQKGLVYLLEAAVSVPDAIFIVAGDGPERDSLERRTRNLGLQGRVRFLGHRRDIPALLAGCDLFVLPSLYEGLGLSIVEAMAAGKPVIATAIGGINEVVIHGVTGLLVTPRSPTELATAIRTLLSNEGLAARLAQAGKARAREVFSSEAMVRGVTRVYEELIDAEMVGLGFSKR